MLFLAECRDAFSGIHELKVSNQSVHCSFVSVPVMDTDIPVEDPVLSHSCAFFYFLKEFDYEVN